MKTRNVLAVSGVMLLIVIVVVAIGLVYVTNVRHPSASVPTATPFPKWELIPNRNQTEEDYRLVSSNGTCEVFLPSGVSVTVPQDCHVVLQECPVTLIGAGLHAQCEALRIESSGLFVGDAEPALTADATMPLPVDCPETGYRVHVIQHGDTLWDLALRYRVTLDALLTTNKLSLWDAEHLAIGYPLCVQLND